LKTILVIERCLKYALIVLNSDPKPLIALLKIRCRNFSQKMNYIFQYFVLIEFIF